MSFEYWSFWRRLFPTPQSQAVLPSSLLMFMVLKPSIASSIPLAVFVAHVLVSVGLYFSTTSTPTSSTRTPRTPAITESYDGGSEDVDDEDDTRKAPPHHHHTPDHTLSSSPTLESIDPEGNHHELQLGLGLRTDSVRTLKVSIRSVRRLGGERRG